MTQPLWVILCRLPDKGRKGTEELIDERAKGNRLIVLGFNDMSTLVGHFVSKRKQRKIKEKVNDNAET